MSMADKQELIHTVALHHMVLKCKAELDQLKSGLQVLSVGDAIKAHPGFFEVFFTEAGLTALTAGTIVVLNLAPHVVIVPWV